MSRKNVDIVISAVDQFTSTLGKATAALAALYGVYKLADEAIAQAQEQENAETKLAIALGKTSQALLDNASAMQRTTKFGDDMVIQAQAAVAAFIKDEDQIRRVTAAAADLATAYGMDLKSASELLTKSISSSTNALSRYGIEITGAAGSSARLESAVNAVNAAFGGQAEAQAQTYSGAIVRIKNAWGDLLEVFGNVIVRNPAVIALMNTLANSLGTAGDRANGMKAYLRGLVRDGLALAVDAVGWLVDGLQYMRLGWEGVKVVANFFIADTAQGLVKLSDLLLNTVLAPFDMLLDKLVQMGAISSNPFAGMQESLAQFAESSMEVFNRSADEAEILRAAYEKTSAAIHGAADALRNTDVSQETNAAAGVSAPIVALQQENGIRLDLLSQRYEAERALAEQHGIWSEEYQMAATAAFDMQQAAAYEKFAATTQSKAELEYFADTQRLQRQSFVVQQQTQLEQLRARTGMQALSDVMAFSQFMYQKSGSSARSFFTLFKAASTAQALIKTYESATSAYSAMAGIPFVGPILGAAAAAAAVVAGMAQVSKIRSMSMGGGAGGGGNPYGSMTLPTAAPPAAAFPGASNLPTLGGTNNQPSGPVNVYLSVYNPLSDDNWDQLAEKHLVPAINNAGNRGVQLQPNVVAVS